MKLIPFLIIFVFSMVYAETGPLQPFPEDVSRGFISPNLHPWSTDIVYWSPITPLSQYQNRSANGTLGNYFYVFGEQNNPYANAFNIRTTQWETSTPPPLGNCNWCGVPTNDAFYIVGRYSGAFGNEVQRFFPAETGPTGTWNTVESYPLAMCGIAAAWDGGDYIYAAGGGGSMGAVVNAFKYSISADEWSPIADLPEPMKYHGGWFCGGKFVVYGGYQTPTTCYVYDPTSNIWTPGAEVPDSVYFATFSTTGNNELLFSIGGGGGYGSWPATNAVQIYDPESDTWTLETPLPEANGLNAAGLIEYQAVLSAGGYPNTYNCFLGVGFTCPIPEVEVNLMCYFPPIQIPPGGGSFNYNIEVCNNEFYSASVDIWIMARLPDSTEYGPIILVRDYVLDPGVPVNRNRTQAVPANAPPGIYSYDAYIGEYPDFVWDEDHFEFEKLITE